MEYNTKQILNNKLNEQSAQKIINEYVAGKSSFQLSHENNVTQATIVYLLEGKTWLNCHRPIELKKILASKHIGRKPRNLPELNQLQKDIITGSMLGDGHISFNKGRRNSVFSKVQSVNKKEYIEWHLSSFSDYSSKIFPVIKKEKLIKNEFGRIERIKQKQYLGGYKFQSYPHPVFTSFRNYWYNDRKFIPHDLLLNPQIISIWFFDDGYNDTYRRFAKIFTNGFLLEEAEMLVEKLKTFDIHPNIKTIKSVYTNRLMPILFISKNSYDNLMNMIKPYMIWKCFEYKVNWHPVTPSWGRTTKLTCDDVLDIRNLASTVSVNDLSKKYQVKNYVINKIIKRKTFKDI